MLGGPGCCRDLTVCHLSPPRPARRCLVLRAESFPVAITPSQSRHSKQNRRPVVQVAGRKQRLFQSLAATPGRGSSAAVPGAAPEGTAAIGAGESGAGAGAGLDILELGLGTGPNLRFYGALPGVRVTGVDPNSAMEPYARGAALAAGLQPSQLSFLQGRGEALPVASDSMDAVVGTLVLCSVADVTAVLQEVKRVLRPGGLYVFLEHCAAPGCARPGRAAVGVMVDKERRQDGTPLRWWQAALDPLQQLLADGCQLTRNPLPLILGAGFGEVAAERVDIPGFGLISPHIVGSARK
eukprot:jgi/Mesen1/10750/ME000903S10085